MNKIVAVLVTYNRKALLEEAIIALLSQTYRAFDVIIIDNNSTDGTYDAIKGYLNDNIKYINTNKNIGGAGGFNVGIKYAIENNYEYAWLMDDDTIPTPNALESLISKAQKLNNDFSYLSSLCKWTDGSIAVMNRQITSDKILDKFDKIHDNLLLISNASFVSFFLNLKYAVKVGLPYKEFFIYGDDWEYCLRLNKENSGYVDIDSIVVHKIVNNVGADIFTSPKDRINRCFYNYRNLFFTFKKHSIKKWIKYNIINFIDLILIPFKAKNRRLKRMWTLIKGNIAGIFFNPKIEYVKKEN